MIRTFCTMFLVFALVAPGASAVDRHDTLAKGPRVGDKIPHSLAAADQNNKYQDFKSLARRRGLVLMFSRSLDW